MKFPKLLRKAKEPTSADAGDQVDATQPENAVRGGTRGKDFELPENSAGKIAGAAVLIAAIVMFVCLFPKGSPSGNGHSTTAHNGVTPTPTPADGQGSAQSPSQADTSATPSDDSTIGYSQLEGTAKHTKQNEATATHADGTLGQVAPFDKSGEWQPPAYQPGMDTGNNGDGVATIADAGSEHNALDAPSLVFVRSRNDGNEARTSAAAVPLPGLDLPTGSKLRAHLETVATTAVVMPVIAVIDYDYVRNGIVLVPAGAKAIGRVEQADQAGYMSIHFESLLLPDGSTLQIEGSAVDLKLRPLKGKVEGAHSGRNIVVRSLSGIGEIGSLIVGGNNQNASNANLVRQQVANNIGDAADQEIGQSTVTQCAVVSVPANTRMYVVLQQGVQMRIKDSSTGTQSQVQESK